MGELGPNFGIDQCGVDQQISPLQNVQTRHGTEWGSFTALSNYHSKVLQEKYLYLQNLEISGDQLGDWDSG
jgi:hypothetical protein